jgi:hypothetical protein
MRCIRFYFVFLICSAFGLPSQLAAQALYGYFTAPADGQTVYSSNITITWTGCSNTTQSSYQTRVNGSLVSTTQSNGLPCPDYSIGKNYSASATLVNGANTLYLRVCDLVDCGESTITVNYVAPAVRVTPDGDTSPDVPQGNNSSYDFMVTNTGGLSANVTFTASCSGAVNGPTCDLSSSSVYLVPGNFAIVTVDFKGETIGSGKVSLKAEYDQYPGVLDSGFVNVSVIDNAIWGVSVVPETATQSVTAGPFNPRFYVANTSQNTSALSDFEFQTRVSGPVTCQSITPPNAPLSPGDPPNPVTWWWLGNVDCISQFACNLQ